MAIQLIIQKELGMQKCENLNQGSFFIEELTDKVEQAVLEEFKDFRKGGVLEQWKPSISEELFKKKALL